MSKVLSRCLIAALVALVVLPAIAGEGRTPIFSASTVITAPGKYIVTRNIIPLFCSGPLIDIQVPSAFPSPPGHVDIDLNGFVLFACPGQPVIRSGGGGTPPVFHDNITIRNGTLGLGTYGIQIVGDPDTGNRKVVIEDVKVMDVEIAGISLEGITDFALRRNNVVITDFLLPVVGQGQTGIVVDAAGRPIRVKGTIEDNQVERTGGGIIVRGGSSVAILNNRVAELANAAPGAIVYNGSDNCLIAENTIETVFGGNGIDLGDSSGCKLHNNVVRGVEQNGIHVAGLSNDNLIFDNVVTLAGLEGLLVEGSRNHVDRNLLNSNCQAGTQACWGLHFAPFAGGVDNTFGRNTARGNGGAPGSCATAGPYPATTDFCDEQPGSTSFTDNLMPGPPLF